MITPNQKQQGIFHAPLKPKDTEAKTDGCRHTNPSICANHSLPNVCAFVRSDGVCMKPPVSWSKQFRVLFEKARKARKKSK